MDMDHDIIVAGGGLNGPALALALQGCGMRVAVVDARPADARGTAGFDGRAYALALASQRLLAALTPVKAEKDITTLQAKAILASVRPRDLSGKTRTHD